MSRPSARVLGALSSLAVTASLAAVLSVPAAAADPVEVFPLVPGSMPEGIASDGATWFAGSMATGAIYTGDLRTGSRRQLVAPYEARAARGMRYDPVADVLWVVGERRLPGGGTSSNVTSYDADTGKVLTRWRVPGTRFLNDVEVTPDGVFVTDSLNDELVVVRPSGVTLLPLSGDWQQPAPGGFGANGIRALASGDLVVTLSETGALYRIDPATGVADRIELTGPALASGDGLVRSGNTLYVVYGFGRDGIAAVTLAADGRSGRVGRELVDSDLDRPSTAVLYGGALYAVNARFTTPPAPDKPFQVVRVALR